MKNLTYWLNQTIIFMSNEEKSIRDKIDKLWKFNMLKTKDYLKMRKDIKEYLSISTEKRMELDKQYTDELFEIQDNIRKIRNIIFIEERKLL